MCRDLIFVVRRTPAAEWRADRKETSPLGDGEEAITEAEMREGGGLGLDRTADSGSRKTWTDTRHLAEIKLKGLSNGLRNTGGLLVIFDDVLIEQSPLLSVLPHGFTCSPSRTATSPQL